MTNLTSAAWSRPGRPVTAKRVTEALAWLMEQPFTGKRIYLPNKGTNAQRFARMLLTLSLKGNLEAARITLERYEGKVAQPISGDPENPIQLQNLTMHEVARRIISKLMEAQRGDGGEQLTIDQVATIVTEPQAVAAEPVNVTPADFDDLL